MLNGVAEAQWAVYPSRSITLLINQSYSYSHIMHPTIPLWSQGNVIYDTTWDFFNFENVKIKYFVSLKTYQQIWCVGLFNSVYVQWNLYYNCKFTKLNVQIPVEFRSKVCTGTGTGTKMLFRYRNRNSGRSMVWLYKTRKRDEYSFVHCLNIQSDLYYPRLRYPRNSIIRGFWGQILVRPTYMKYRQTSMICTSIIRGFWDQNLVRPSTVDNRGPTVYN